MKGNAADSKSNCSGHNLEADTDGLPLLVFCEMLIVL